METRPYRVTYPAPFYSEGGVYLDTLPTNAQAFVEYPYRFEAIEGVESITAAATLPDGRKGFLVMENLSEGSDDLVFFGPEPPPENTGRIGVIALAILLALSAFGCAGKGKTLSDLASDAMSCVPEVAKAAVACVGRKQAERRVNEACANVPQR